MLVLVTAEFFFFFFLQVESGYGDVKVTGNMQNRSFAIYRKSSLMQTITNFEDN